MSEGFFAGDKPHNPLEGAVFAAGAGPELQLAVGDDCARFSLRIAPAHLDRAIGAFGFDIPSKIEIGRASCSERV